MCSASDLCRRTSCAIDGPFALGPPETGDSRDARFSGEIEADAESKKPDDVSHARDRPVGSSNSPTARAGATRALQARPRSVRRPGPTGHRSDTTTPSDIPAAPEALATHQAGRQGGQNLIRSTGRPEVGRCPTAPEGGMATIRTNYALWSAPAVSGGGFSSPFQEERTLSAGPFCCRRFSGLAGANRS